MRIVDDFDEFVQTVSLQELVGELLFLEGVQCSSTVVYRLGTYSDQLAQGRERKAKSPIPLRELLHNLGRLNRRGIHEPTQRNKRR